MAAPVVTVVCARCGDATARRPRRLGPTSTAASGAIRQVTGFRKAASFFFEKQFLN